MSNQSFLVIDGDKIGDILAVHYLENDIEGLRKTDEILRHTFANAASVLKEIGCDMIAAGADGITCRISGGSLESTLAKLFENPEALSYSCGIGPTLRDAFLALRYAKAKGRSRIGVYSSDQGFTAYQFEGHF